MKFKSGVLQIAEKIFPVSLFKSALIREIFCQRGVHAILKISCMVAAKSKEDAYEVC